MSRFNGNRNVALKSAHILRKLIMDVRVTHSLDEKRALLAKSADASLIEARSRVPRSKDHVIVRSGAEPSTLFSWRNYLSLPIFKIFCRFDGRIDDRRERRQERGGLFALIELLCKVAINFSIR